MDDPSSRTRSEEDWSRTRELGRHDAAAFDQRLRDEEAREREARLSELAWQPGQAADREDAHQLRARVDELSFYVRAVQGSVVWRAAQWARRLVGRAW